MKLAHFAQVLTLALLAMPDLATGHISIDKQLPVAGGIGGGSADAAAVLRLLQAVNPADAARPAWGQLAAGLGADVPVCLAQQAAWIGGAGDRVALVHALPRMAAVLANAQDPVPTAKTAAVFRQLAARPFAAGTGAAHPERFTDAAALIAFVATHGNDLEPPARTLMPSIGATLAALAGCPGARAVRLSGAGPTCFALFEHADAARSAARRLALDHPGWWVRATELG